MSHICKFNLRDTISHSPTPLNYQKSFYITHNFHHTITSTLASVVESQLPPESPLVIFNDTELDTERDFSNSSILGRLPLRFLGKDSVSLYPDTPIGFLVSRRVYSTITLFLALHKIMPILGWSSLWRNRSSTADK